MRYKLIALTTLLGFISVFSLPYTASAAEPTNRGLFMSPVRSYVTMDANEQKTRSFTVANLTDKPLDITFSVEEFSVADYTYQYDFRSTRDNWIKLVTNRITLAPSKSEEIAYTISIPQSAAPGGHYYTLFASTNLSNQGSANKVRVASLLYLKVNGKTTQTNSLVASSLPWLVVSPTIPYTIDVKNTGNTHYFAYFSDSIRGLFYSSSPSGSSSLLMPGTTRRINGSIPSPILPGIYKATISYKPDGAEASGRSQYILYLPPWSLILMGFLGFAGYKLYQRRKRTFTSTPPTDS